MAQDLFKINLFFSFNIISSKAKKKLADLMKKQIYKTTNGQVHSMLLKFKNQLLFIIFTAKI